MCGREVGTLVDAVVEGSSMKVCLNCSKFGNVITINPEIVEKHIEREKEDFKTVDVIRDDYSSLIKKSREKKGLKQESLAKAIAEKESVIHQLESGNLKPSLKLAKKLGVYLDIDLIETVSQASSGTTKDINFKSSNLTIGDVLKEE